MRIGATRKKCSRYSDSLGRFYTSRKLVTTAPASKTPKTLPHPLLAIFITSSWLFYDFFSPFLIPSDMRAQDEMALALHTTLIPAPNLPAPPTPARAFAPALNIAVVFTSVDATLSALKEAAELASRLNGRITLLVPQVVPYPLPLTSPPVLIDWNERRFRMIAANSAVETQVQIYLCRDPLETLRRTLHPHSLILIGGRKRWLPTPERRLARQLRRVGHEVIFKETE